MRRFFFAVVVAMSLAALVAGPLPVMGQESNATATETGETAETVAVQLDESTRIAEWSYQNGSWSVTLDAENPKVVTVTDSARAMQAWADADGKTAADLNPERYALSSGETTITYPGSTFDGQAAITVATSDGMRFLATDGIETARQPVPWTTVQGLIGFTGLAAVSGTFYWVKRKYESQDEEIERIT